jgi:type I restriction enzyme, R subunit
VSQFIAESAVEELCLGYFSSLGWEVHWGPDLAPGEPRAQRTDFRQVLLSNVASSAIARLNPGLPSEALAEAVTILARPESADLMLESLRIHEAVTGGLPVEVRQPDGSVRSVPVRLVDFDKPDNNVFWAVNQFRVEGDFDPRRPDIVLFVNGIPLGVIELKVPGEERATLGGAYKQLCTYEHDIPALMSYADVSVIATGTRARMGTIASPFEHYAPWKTIDGEKLAPSSVPQLEVLVRGVFKKETFLDLVRFFVAFTDERNGLVKRVAKYQQYHAVNKAISATIEAIKRGDGRAGVVWHTQGSGKSWEMLFFANKAMQQPELANPTLVFLTDRNALDDQLFDEVFAATRNLVEAPKQAASRENLQELLKARASGGILFSTMQKFGLSQKDKLAGRSFPLLSDRSNVIVITDEAHRTQYDLIDGLARNLRDALPNAAFLGFTGTPIEFADRNTRDVFGDYIDIYDLTQSIDDGATVKVYYEARLVKVEIPAELRDELDEGFEEATELTEVEDRERLKTRWARVEAIVGAKKRLEAVAADIVTHWEARRSAQVGKGFIVCMSRRICCDLYDEIVKLRPNWHATDDDAGTVKVVITGSATDGPRMNQHIRGTERLRKLKARAKDPTSTLELVIVRDMWLTGFDSPPMHTMYVDKPMQGAGLMQAIARVNRTFRDKPGGLVVDYLGIAESLRAALSDYTERDRTKSEVGAPLEEALELLEEKHEVLTELLYGCPWRDVLASGAEDAGLRAIMVALEHLLGGEELDLPNRFIHHTRLAKQAFALCVSSPEARRFRDDLAFFQAVAVELRRARAEDAGETDTDDVDVALRQVISDAITAPEVIDIYAQAGIERPDVSIIDDEFAKRFATNPTPNVQIELLRRILNSEMKNLSKVNVVVERKFSEMLDRAVAAYRNRSLTAAEVIAELVELAKELTAERGRGESLGLRQDELAFYDAVRQNDSAVLELGDDVLQAIARELVEVVRRNATVDWDKKEQVRANLRRNVRRLLARYHYPPDRQEEAVLLVMQQAEVLAREEAA